MTKLTLLIFLMACLIMTIAAVRAGSWPFIVSAIAFWVALGVQVRAFNRNRS